MVSWNLPLYFLINSVLKHCKKVTSLEKIRKIFISKANGLMLQCTQLRQIQVLHLTKSAETDSHPLT
jgi:hypothetical protein